MLNKKCIFIVTALNILMKTFFHHSQELLRALNKNYRRSFLKKNPFSSRMSVLLGQQGVGKTTVLIQYLLNYAHNDVFSNDILYVASDHFFMQGRALYEIADEFVKFSGKVLCLDEIHKYSNWSQELKSIYDSFPKLKIIASGSCALEIYKGSHDLTRRAIKYYLPGLSFKEFIELQLTLEFEPLSFEQIIQNHQKSAAAVIEIVERQGAKILPLFNEYLQFGYYPYIDEFRNNPTLYYLTLEQNVHTIIESDLMSIYPNLTGVSIEKIKRLLVYLSYQTPYKVDLVKLMRAIDIAHPNSLKTYLKYLTDAEVITALFNEGKSLAAFEKPQKIYHSNTNQLFALADNQPNRGTLRETFFLNAVRPAKTVYYSEIGDFNVDGWIFEVGGKNKSFKQIKSVKNSYLAVDDIEMGIGNSIPLWLFGFLY